MIHFPARRELVAQVQTALGLKPDGIDGQATWHGLAAAILGIDHPAMRGRTAKPSAHAFIGRSALVKAVQSKLRITMDGMDGSETWSAIAEFFFPAPLTQKTASSGKYNETLRGRSPNRNPGTNDCKGLVVHHAAGYFEGTIDWCLRPKTHAAYHCLIAPDGTRAILGQDADRLHHAGKSVWKGRASCNNFMLGIAFTGNTNTGAMRATKDLNSAELASALEWIKAKQILHNIPNSEITHHRVISPGRKDDLSPAAWEQLKKRL